MHVFPHSIGTFKEDASSASRKQPPRAKKASSVWATAAIALMWIAAPMAQAQQPTWMTNGLVAYYPLDGDAREATQNTANGVEVAMAYSQDRFGVAARSAQFNGTTSCIIVSNGPAFMLTNAVTLSAWVKNDSPAGPYRFIIGKDTQGKPDFKFQISKGDNRIMFYTSRSSAAVSLAPIQTTWHHYVGVSDGHANSLYENGTLVTSTTESGDPMIPVDSPLTMGRLPHPEATEGGSWMFWKGSLDDVRIYSRALSVGEVKALHEYESVPHSLPPRQATATPQVVNGFVVGTTITDGGYAYTNNPSVTIVGGGGSGATATSQIDTNGSVTKITILSPGSGYTNAPQVLIAAPPYPPEQAVASAQVVNGFLVGVTLTNGGRGYAQTPRIWLNGGGGTGASVSAGIDTNGTITGIQVLNPGSGYTNAPQVVIEPPVFPLPRITLAPGQQVAFGQLQAGTSYQLQTLSTGSWTNTGATITATNSTHTLDLPGRSDCRLLPLPLPRTATATPSVVNGFLVGITVADGGSGYTSSPSVTIQDATGTGATTSVTVLTGAVTRVQIISPGSGYSANPTVTIAPPPVVAIAGSSSPAVTLNMLNLFPNIPYQLERTSDLKTFVPVGGTFLPTATTNNVTVNAGTGVSFYRVVYRR